MRRMRLRAPSQALSLSLNYLTGIMEFFEFDLWNVTLVKRPIDRRSKKKEETFDGPVPGSVAQRPASCTVRRELLELKRCDSKDSHDSSQAFGVGFPRLNVRAP